MKDITLSITGVHFYDNEEGDRMEFVTEGKMYQRGETIYLTYDESYITGLEGCTTRLALKGDTVRMVRRGKSIKIDTEMRFEKGQRYLGYYDTELGPIEMELLTNELKNDVTYDNACGTIDIDYDISLKGLAEGHSRLNIQVCS